MTSLSWVSGRRESSRNCIGVASYEGEIGNLIGTITDDPGPFHLPDRGPVIHHGVMLGAAIVPDGDAVRLPAPAHRIFGDRRAADQVAEQVVAAGREILAVAHVVAGAESGEVGGEAADEQHLLAGCLVRAENRMFRIRILRLECETLRD